jgi:predicted DCC family thiol-disulfide oxidoreductase YuxK
MSTPKLTIFYDGLCPLCSREIAHYRRRIPDGNARFVDITDPGFDAASHGLDGDVHRIMHVRVGDEIRTRVDAFLAIWEAIPSYRWLARIGRLPGIHALLRLGYASFARVRPWLPRRQPSACQTGSCQR